MTLFLFVAAVVVMLYGCSISRRSRRNHDRAETMLRRARLTRVLWSAVEDLGSVERHLVRTLPTGDPRRLAIIHRMLDDLEGREMLAPAEVETALHALDVASGRR